MQQHQQTAKQTQKSYDAPYGAPKQSGTQYGDQGGAAGKAGNIKGDAHTCDPQKPPQAQQEVDQMGNGKAEEITIHAVSGQQQEQKENIQTGGNDVVTNAGLLLAQSLGHGIGDGISVEHGDQQGIVFQAPAGLAALV